MKKPKLLILICFQLKSIPPFDSLRFSVPVPAATVINFPAPGQLTSNNGTIGQRISGGIGHFITFIHPTCRPGEALRPDNPEIGFHIVTPPKAKSNLFQCSVHKTMLQWTFGNIR